MKRLFTLVLILYFFILSGESKAQILWERIEQDLVTYRDQYNKILVKDSLIFLNGTGYWNAPLGHQERTFYSCYNLNGKLKWRKNGRDIYMGNGGDLIMDSDSMLLSYRYNSNWFKLSMLKIRMTTGDTLPQTQFTVPYSFQGIPNGFMIKEPTGGYFIGGYLVGVGGPTISKLSSSGSPLWTKRHNWYNATNYTGFSNFTDFKRKANGNYVVLGDYQTVPNLHHGEHPVLAEFKPNGDTLRTRKFILEDPTFNEVTFYSKLTQTRGGGYLFSGRIDTVVDNCHGCDAKYFVAKIDAQFNLKWIYKNSGVLKEHHIYKAYELADSSFVALAGRWDITNPTQPTGEYIIIKISKTGQYLFHTSYSNNFCNGLPMLQDWVILPDGTSIVAGKCKHHGYSYLARLASVGAPAVLGEEDEIEINNNYSAEAYPNPATETVTFSYNLPSKAKNAELRIVEVATGKLVKTVALKGGEKREQISIRALSAGLYAYTFFVNSIPVNTKKLVIVK